MDTKKKPHRGAPAGNKNAAKPPGFYNQVFNTAEQIEFLAALNCEGVDEEIALLRMKLKALVEEQPDRLDLAMEAASTIARLVRTRYNISKEQKKSLKDAITKVLTEIALPMGVRAIIK